MPPEQITLNSVRTLAGGLDHPEGVALGPDGMLYAGGEAGQVYRIDPAAAAAEQIADTEGFALGVALDAAGSVYVCDSVQGAVMRVDVNSGVVDRWCEAAGGVPIKTPNWGAFAADGSMWLTDSGTESPDACDGRLLRVPAGGGDAEAIELEPLHFPNGACLGADGRPHWVESFTPRLRRLGDSGAETVAELPGMVPDGIALDADGGFVIACYYPFQLLYLAAGGTTAQMLLDDPLGQTLAMPTNVAFFGDGLTELAVANLGGYDIKALPAPVPGAPLVYP